MQFLATIAAALTVVSAHSIPQKAEYQEAAPAVATTCTSAKSSVAPAVNVPSTTSCTEAAASKSSAAPAVQTPTTSCTAAVSSVAPAAKTPASSCTSAATSAIAPAVQTPATSCTRSATAAAVAPTVVGYKPPVGTSAVAPAGNGPNNYAVVKGTNAAGILASGAVGQIVGALGAAIAAIVL
ncbi:hypothetical protein HDU77_003117 [Chytriomyces hyalinus]|nr:hypothetical protein HDU77_003117 [Chytriomyces hyalinus]